MNTSSATVYKICKTCWRSTRYMMLIVKGKENLACMECGAIYNKPKSTTQPHQEKS